MVEALSSQVPPSGGASLTLSWAIDQMIGHVLALTDSGSNFEFAQAPRGMSSMVSLYMQGAWSSRTCCHPYCQQDQNLGYLFTPIYYLATIVYKSYVKESMYDMNLIYYI